VPSQENWWRNVLFLHYSQLRDLTIFSLKTKIFQKLINPTKKFFFSKPQQNKKFLMILNDKPNFQC
jgi:hypothetical protein